MAGRPALAGIIHVALTVTDVEASVAWYERVLGFSQVATVPHDGGYGVVLATADQRVWVALHRHDGNDGAAFSVVTTGLDHVALQVPTHAELEAWAAWLAAEGVACSDILDLPDFDVAALVFADPDGIPLELIAPRRGG